MAPAFLILKLFGEIVIQIVGIFHIVCCIVRALRFCESHQIMFTQQNAGGLGGGLGAAGGGGLTLGGGTGGFQLGAAGAAPAAGGGLGLGGGLGAAAGQTGGLTLGGGAGLNMGGTPNAGLGTVYIENSRHIRRKIQFFC